MQQNLSISLPNIKSDTLNIDTNTTLSYSLKSRCVSPATFSLSKLYCRFLAFSYEF